VAGLWQPVFSDPRSNNAWRIYEFVAGYKADAPPIDVTLSEMPVPTCAAEAAHENAKTPTTSCHGSEP
jgi:hypothetical protein